MTWKEIIVMSLGVFVALVLIEVGFYIFDETAQSPATQYTLTNNMKDCQDRGGTYRLTVGSDGKILHEYCNIAREIDYQSDKTN